MTLRYRQCTITLVFHDYVRLLHRVQQILKHSPLAQHWDHAPFWLSKLCNLLWDHTPSHLKQGNLKLTSLGWDRESWWTPFKTSPMPDKPLVQPHKQLIQPHCHQHLEQPVAMATVERIPLNTRQLSLVDPPAAQQLWESRQYCLNLIISNSLLLLEKAVLARYNSTMQFMLLLALIACLALTTVTTRLQVYLAEQNGEVFAVKAIAKEMLSIPKRREGLFRERNILKVLSKKKFMLTLYGTVQNPVSSIFAHFLLPFLVKESNNSLFHCWSLVSRQLLIL